MLSRRTFKAIPVIIAAAIVLAITLAACGLPDTISLPKPLVVNTGNSYVIGFETPADTTGILGYTIYYKVYFSNTDFLDEDDDDVWFDEGTYINSNAEMQPGPVIPNQRGYIRFGESGDDSTSYKSFQISEPGPSTTVYIDFDPTSLGVFGKDNGMPIVHLGPIGPPEPVALNYLVRGVIDPTDSNLLFRTFVKNPINPGNVSDWDYDDGDGDNFYDADLRRKHNLNDVSSVSTLTAELLTGVPFAGLPPGDLTIGAVVHSYGLDVVKFQVLYSKPVYLGRVIYSPLDDTNRINTVR